MSRILATLNCMLSPKAKQPSYSQPDAIGGAQKKSGQGADTPKQRSAEIIIKTLLKTHSLLKDLPNLRPGNDVNRILSGLVSLCSQIHDTKTIELVFQDLRIQAILASLRGMCSESEYHLEKHWAEVITSEPTTEKALACLKSFPYYENYEDLTRLEISAMIAADPVLPTKVAFIGSGPLPLTSLCLLSALKSGVLPGSRAEKPPQFADHPSDLEVLNIDHNDEAIVIASALINKLGPLGRGMTFAMDSAGSKSCDLSRFDTVYLAALVGDTQSKKEDLLSKVAANMRDGALIIMRTSWGLRSCLYPEIDMTTEKILRSVEVCSVVHPYGHVVNSVIVAKVRPRRNT